MDTILLKRVDLCAQIETTSLYDLSKPINLDKLFCAPKHVVRKKETAIDIPDYLNQNYNMTENTLYRYLND